MELSALPLLVVTKAGHRIECHEIRFCAATGTMTGPAAVIMRDEQWVILAADDIVRVTPNSPQVPPDSNSIRTDLRIAMPTANEAEEIGAEIARRLAAQHSSRKTVNVAG